MSEFNRTNSYVNESGDTLQAYITKVFLLMGIGLGITALVAFLSYMSLVSGGFVAQLLANPFTLILLIVAELGIAVAMSAGITRFSTGLCRVLFFAYSALTGITFGVLPMVYGIDTMFVAFIFATVLFVSCAVIGYTTKVDLTRFSGILMAGLIAVVVLSLLSIFIPVLRNNLIIGYLGLLVFLGLTAFDMQRIKSFYYNGIEGEMKENLAVFGAFELYLDFINILLRVLQILGSRNNN